MQQVNQGDVIIGSHTIPLELPSFRYISDPSMLFVLCGTKKLSKPIGNRMYPGETSGKLGAQGEVENPRGMLSSFWKSINAGGKSTVRLNAGNVVLVERVESEYTRRRLR